MNNFIKALLSGLLGSIGNQLLSPIGEALPLPVPGESSFWPWPGSALAKKAGKWIMASEIVETSRLYARTIAKYRTRVAGKKSGAHLIKKSWSDPPLGEKTPET